MDWTEFFDKPVYRVGWAEVTFGSLLAAAAVYLLVHLGSRMVERRTLDRLSAAGTRTVSRVVAIRALRFVVLVVAAVVALGLAGVDLARVSHYELFRIGDRAVVVSSIATAVVIVFGSFAVSRIVQSGLERSASKNFPHAAGTAASIGRLLHYVVVLVGLAVALQTLGVELGAFLAVGGVFMLALGFAMKTIAENFISGVILLVEQAIKPGDVLEVEGRVVRVVRLGIRTTIAKTRDGEELIIPNSSVVHSTVKNYTYRDSLYRIRVAVGVVYASDMKVVRETLQRCAESMPWRVESPGPEVMLVNFGDHSVGFEANVWMTDPWRSRHAKSELHEAIWWALKDVGVTIAFPQLDVHLDQQALDALAGRRGSPDAAAG